MKTQKRLTPKERAAAHAAEMQRLKERRERQEQADLEREERRRSLPPGSIGGTFEIHEMLRSRYGISRAGTEWLLYRSPYRPPEVRGVDLEIYGIPGLVHFSTHWNDQEIDASARKFMTECHQDSPTLWSHPKVKGRFKLRPPMAS